MKKKKVNIFKIVITILGLLLIASLLVFYQSVFWMLIGAVIFSYLFRPAVEFLEKMNISRWVSILLIYLIIAGILTFAILLIVPVFVSQLQDIGSKVSEVASQSGSLEDFKITDVESFRKLMKPVIEFNERTKIVNFNKIFQDFLLSLKTLVTDLPQRISVFASKLFNIFTFLFMVPTIGFFLLNEHEKFRKVFFSFIPNKYFELTVILLEKTDYVFKTYFRAMMIEIMIVAVMSSISMMIVGVPYSIVIGLIAGVANIIPYLGPWIGIIAAIVSILISGEPLMMIISSIIALQVVQILENRIVYPIVMGRSMDMHPLVILLTVLAGGYSFGFLGMFLSVPVIFLIKELVTILFENLKKFEII